MGGARWDCLILCNDCLFSDHLPNEGVLGARVHTSTSHQVFPSVYLPSRDSYKAAGKWGPKKRRVLFLPWKRTETKGQAVLPFPVSVKGARGDQDRRPLPQCKLILSCGQSFIIHSTNIYSAATVYQEVIHSLYTLLLKGGRAENAVFPFALWNSTLFLIKNQCHEVVIDLIQSRSKISCR